MKRLVMWVVLTLVVAAGCVTPSRVRSLPDDSGKEVLLSGTFQAAGLAARNAVAATALEIIEAGEAESDGWYLIAEAPGGELVRVLCRQIRSGVVAVRVLTKRGFGDTGDDWAPTILSQIALELEVLSPP